MQNQLSIAYEANGKVHIIGNELAHNVLLVLHGYGQMATDFIHFFEIFVKNGWMIVLPEAPHYFYKKGVSGEVVASWMTKHNRQLAIKQYINFLNATQKIIGSTKKWSVLGFSQGGATAVRWVQQANDVANLIL